MFSSGHISYSHKMSFIILSSSFAFLPLHFLLVYLVLMSPFADVILKSQTSLPVEQGHFCVNGNHTVRISWYLCLACQCRPACDCFLLLLLLFCFLIMRSVMCDHNRWESPASQEVLVCHVGNTIFHNSFLQKKTKKNPLQTQPILYKCYWCLNIFRLRAMPGIHTTVCSQLIA